MYVDNKYERIFVGAPCTRINQAMPCSCRSRASRTIYNNNKNKLEGLGRSALTDTDFNVILLQSSPQIQGTPRPAKKVTPIFSRSNIPSKHFHRKICALGNNNNNECGVSVCSLARPRSLRRLLWIFDRS